MPPKRISKLQSGTPFRTPRRFAFEADGRFTARFWSARAPAPLSYGADLGFDPLEKMIFLHFFVF
jgi:hypothetical protein